MTVNIGLFGTSWWTDTMYLPPIDAHPGARALAVCGRRQDPADEIAARWDIPNALTDPDAMLSLPDLDAVVIATANDSHHDLAIAAIDRGLHVLCEKPIALDVDQADVMAARARDAGVITMVPFTYHYMPVNRWVQRLVADGFVGRPLHLNLRYYTGFGFDSSYAWRFDREIAGSGVIGDIGSHWIHLARWLIGEPEQSISAVSTTFTDRDPRPDGGDYERMEDSVVMTVRYRSGAYGVLQTSAVCHEPGRFGQSHHIEVHGTEGTVHATCDWQTVQSVRGFRPDGDLSRWVPESTADPERSGMVDLPIPDDIWGTVRRDRVHDTYRDVFRNTSAMTRAWVDAIVAGEQIQPDFDEGLAVQRVLDAAVASAADGGCPMLLDHRT